MITKNIGDIAPHFCLLHFAFWLLFKSFRQFGFEVGEGESARGQQYEAVVEHVAHFVEDAVIAFVGERGDDDFDGFLADLLADFSFTGGKQLGGVRFGAGVGFAVFDGGEQGFEGSRHGLR